MCMWITLHDIDQNERISLIHAKKSSINAIFETDKNLNEHGGCIVQIGFKQYLVKETYDQVMKMIEEE